MTFQLSKNKSSMSVENLVIAFEIFPGGKMQYIELSVKERQEIKHLRTWVSYFLTSKKYVLCLSYKICLTKNCPCRYEVFHGDQRSNPYCGFECASVSTIAAKQFCSTASLLSSSISSSASAPPGERISCCVLCSGSSLSPSFWDK